MNFGRENEELEFKESLTELDSGLKSLTAMLNKNGKGKVLFGVNDAGEVTNQLVIGKNTISTISQRIQETCEPRFFFVSKVIDADDGIHAVIEVSAEGDDRPYSFQGRYFERNGERDEKASGALVRRMLLSSGGDMLTSLESQSQELTFLHFASHMLSRKVHYLDKPSFYKSHNMMKGDGLYNFNAFLMSEENSFPLKAVLISGKKKGDISEIKSMESGCLFAQLSQMLSYISSINQTRVQFVNGLRVENDLFSFGAFREALVNALAHNAWWLGLPPSVYIYDNRIEVESYGALPYGLTMEEFFSGRSHPVNPGLFQLFLLAGYSEQSGRGVPYIVDECGQEAFVIENDMVKVIIPFRFMPDHVRGRLSREKSLSDLSDSQKEVYDFLSSNPESTLEEAASVSSISLTSAKNAVKKLNEENLLIRTGSKKKGKWLVL